jgi:hypothetical protein
LITNPKNVGAEKLKFGISDAATESKSR